MTNKASSTLLEDFLLLALDERSGGFHPLDSQLLDRATAAAVMMDLTLRNRIDNDLRDVFTVDSAPTGDEILDAALEKICQAPVLKPQSVTYWLSELTVSAQGIRNDILRRLEKKNILRRPLWGALWMFGQTGAQSKVDPQRAQEIISQLKSVLYGHEIPTPREIMLTALAKASGLTDFILNDTEKRDTARRLTEVASMDLIGQSIAETASLSQTPVAAAGGSR